MNAEVISFLPMQGNKQSNSNKGEESIAIAQLLDLVASIRNGNTVGLTVVTTSNSGKVETQKILGQHFC